MTNAAKVYVTGAASQSQSSGLESLSAKAAAVTTANRQYFARTRSTLRAVESAKTGSSSSVPTASGRAGTAAQKV